MKKITPSVWALSVLGGHQWRRESAGERGAGYSVVVHGNQRAGDPRSAHGGKTDNIFIFVGRRYAEVRIWAGAPRINARVSLIGCWKWWISKRLEFLQAFMWFRNFDDYQNGIFLDLMRRETFDLFQPQPGKGLWISKGNQHVSNVFYHKIIFRALNVSNATNMFRMFSTLSFSECLKSKVTFFRKILRCACCVEIAGERFWNDFVISA